MSEALLYDVVPSVEARVMVMLLVPAATLTVAAVVPVVSAAPITNCTDGTFVPVRAPVVAFVNVRPLFAFDASVPKMFVAEPVTTAALPKVPEPSLVASPPLPVPNDARTDERQ